MSNIDQHGIGWLRRVLTALEVEQRRALVPYLHRSFSAKEPYKRDDILQKRPMSNMHHQGIGWLRRVLTALEVEQRRTLVPYLHRSFSAKEPYKRDDILQKRRCFAENDL